jgi:hypothetical protein
MTTPTTGAARRARRWVAVAGCLMALALAMAGCGDDDGDAATSDTTDDSGAGGEPVIDPGDGGDYRPTLDPATVADRIDNPYLPLLPGARWVYEGTSSEGQERIEVAVLDERRSVMGIDAVVVRDTVSTDGQVIEDTYDWYTQDAEGNVWYLGEETAEYEDGQVVSTEGSWAAGVDGALPGVVMWAQPRPGQAYRQEFYRGQAEDLAEVLTVGERVTVAGSTYDDAVVIREWNPLEPDVVEVKSYAPGVGPVLEEQTAGGDDRVVLAQYTAGTAG